MHQNDPRRQLPSVHSLLDAPPVQALIETHGRETVLAVVQRVLDAARQALAAGGEAPGDEAITAEVAAALAADALAALQPVINATGVVIHTNLGRTPLSEAAQRAVMAVASGYSNLEYRLDEGRRGGRGQSVEAMLRQLIGAESALVVNNAASAVLLALSALAKGGEVIIARGQLIEIGGGFRIPAVMAQSGAQLVEVGTTNRTRLSDFEAALGDETRLVFAAHHSNFRIVGFHEEPDIAALADLAHRHGISMMHDLGSGALLDTASYGLTHEPTAQESVSAGADVVTFSGDKLLGGPQAGCIVGRAELVERLRRHPLARAARIDKYCMAGLGATLKHYVEGEAAERVPVWQMLARAPGELEATAGRWAGALNARGVAASVQASRSAVGGGSLPEETLPTFVTALDHSHPDDLIARLRRGRPPVVARIEDGRVVLDPRTVLAGQEDALLDAVAAALRTPK